MHTEVTLLYEAVSNELRDNDSPWGVGTTCDDITKHQEQENNKKEHYSRCQIWVKEFIQNKTQQDVQFDRFHVTSSRDRAIRATFLESVVARITTHLKHCHATKFCCWKLKKFVEKSRRQFNMLLQLATTKFCCVTMSKVGWSYVQQRFSTCNATICCIASCSNLLLVLLHLVILHVCRSSLWVVVFRNIEFLSHNSTS